MGPAWFWPKMQPRMRGLVESLRLASFPQYSTGDIIVERFKLEPPRRYRGDAAAAFPSMRIEGGSRALANALSARLGPGDLFFDTKITRIEREFDGVVLYFTTKGLPRRIKVADCVIAIPPRLAVSTISFEPPLDAAVAATLGALPTWMARQAKVTAVYDRPFWREAGLSGTASSFVGPLGEIHDASPRSGAPALFGFVTGRAEFDQNVLRALAVEQLVRLFGPSANHPLAVLVKDWATDALTATPADLEGPASHPAYGIAVDQRTCWDGRLAWAGSETAPEHGGYLEGALEAAELVVAGLRR